MGTLEKSEKSKDNAFQFALWDNDGNYIVELKKFNKNKGFRGRNFSAPPQQMTFTIREFENFKKWIKKYKKEGDQK